MCTHFFLETQRSKSSRGKRMSGLNLQCSVRLRCFVSETWQESIDFPRSKQASANSLRQLMALFFSISQGLVYWLCTALTMVKHCIKAKNTGVKWSISMGPRHAYVSGLAEEDEVRISPLYPGFTLWAQGEGCWMASQDIWMRTKA